MSTVPQPVLRALRFRLRLSARSRKLAARVLAGLLLLWIAFVGFIFWAMYQPPEKFARVMSHMPWQVFLILPFETLWTHARAGTVHIGDGAPDFSLLKPDKTETIHLSELNKKQPVVMIFGSYT